MCQINIVERMITNETVYSQKTFDLNICENIRWKQNELIRKKNFICQNKGSFFLEKCITNNKWSNILFIRNSIWPFIDKRPFVFYQSKSVSVHFSLFKFSWNEPMIIAAKVDRNQENIKSWWKTSSSRKSHEYFHGLMSKGAVQSGFYFKWKNLEKFDELC